MMLRSRTVAAGLVALALTVGAVAVPARAADDIGRQMEREYGVLGTDTEEGRRLNRMLDDVVSRTFEAIRTRKRYEGFQYKSATILGGKSKKTDEVINAFALPDGRIYVTLGLLRALSDSSRPEDELAFVVGHELTHVAEKHGRSQSKQAVKAGLAAILLGAITRSKTVQEAAGVGAAAYVSKYSRQDEYEADKGGLIALKRAGYDLDASIDMLNRLKSRGESSGANKLINGWFGSHPLTENRVARIREMIGKIQRGEPLKD